MCATRGWEHYTQTDVAQRAQKAAPKPSKYKNVKVVVDGQQFDSKREAGEWLKLKARQLAGEISDLQRQVVFPLYAPERCATNPNGPLLIVEVARYLADFTFVDQRGVQHVVDAKGKRTALYSLKAKWLHLQDGITIVEV